MRTNEVGKKFVSVLMSVVLAVGLMPLPAYAGDTAEAASPTQDDQSQPLVAGSVSQDALEESAPALTAAAAEQGSLLAAATTSVTFKERSWKDFAVTSKDTTKDANPVPSDGSMTSGWYYLNSNVTVNKRVVLTGDTHLILGNDKTLSVKGLYIPKGKTLTIYAQSDGDNAGKLVSKASDGTGIGAYSKHKGGNIVIHGGNIEVTGGNNCAGIGGNDDDRKDIGSFTMYGGKVTTQGGSSGAGIGGGRACEGGTITIYGGEVKATGGDYAAGIGGGNGQDTNPLRGAHAGTITIWGGKVTATGGSDGAGIGGGEGGNAGTIAINGGTVTATGGNNGAGIGCGEGESTGIGGTVTITKGTAVEPTVTATGGGDGAGIGGGEGGHCDTITIEGGAVTATGGNNGAGIGAGRDADGGTIKISGGTVTATGTNSSAGIGGGDASGSYADYSAIEITGGTVTATGHSQGAGIGGGEYGHATITITGGTVNATGGTSGGAGIGDGRDGSGSAIILGYTDETAKDISITASSYRGVTTLSKPFRNTQTTFRPTGSVSNLSSLAANPPLVAWLDADVAEEQTASSWAELQNVIDNNVSNKLTVKLNGQTNGQTIKANGADAITVPYGKDVTIDLNGATLDRELANLVNDGSAIVVSFGARLTIKDSVGGGKITGGAATNGGGIYNAGILRIESGTISHNKANAGGGIYNTGILTVSGGSITGNTSTTRGGGIYLPDKSSGSSSAVLHLEGGTIEDNTCGYNGGGIHISETAFMDIAGNPVVRGNTKVSGTDATTNNVSLADGASSASPNRSQPKRKSA